MTFDINKPCVHRKAPPQPSHHPTTTTTSLHSKNSAGKNIPEFYGHKHTVPFL